MTSMRIRPPTDPAQRFEFDFPASKPFDLVGLGENTVDHICVLPLFPRLDTKTEILRYEKVPGGQVATAVTCAARMGLKAKYLGKVGGDELGCFSLTSLQAEDIDTSSVMTAESARNHCSFILIDQKSGERTILWDRDPRLNFLSGELKREDVCAGRMLLLDQTDPRAARQAAIWARDAGIPVIVDLDKATANSKDLIALVDLLIVSADFPAGLTGVTDPIESLQALREFCPGFLAVTLGARGAMAVVGDRCVHFPALPVQAIDTTGAGDVFRGGFIYGLLHHWPLEQIMAFANAAAGLSCTRLGARAGIAPVAEILPLAQGLAGKHC